MIPIPSLHSLSLCPFLSLSNIDVATEKTQKSIFEGITAFDQTNLKHTETNEKNPLPDKEGAQLAAI